MYTQLQPTSKMFKLIHQGNNLQAKKKKDKDELKQYTQSLHMQVKMFSVLCLCLRALDSSGNETA